MTSAWVELPTVTPMFKTLAGTALSVISIVAIITATATAGSAQQDPNVLVIELSGVLSGAEGEVIDVYDEPVPANLVGATCTATATTANNGSVHPGNDVLLADSNGVARIENVEETPGQVLTGSAPVVLPDGNLVISLELGPSGTSSGGVTLRLDCEPVPTPTTAPPTTAAPETSSTVAPPTGGVDTGAGGLAGDGGRNTAAAAALLLLVGAAGVTSVGVMSRRRR